MLGAPLLHSRGPPGPPTLLSLLLHLQWGLARERGRVLPIPQVCPDTCSDSPGARRACWAGGLGLAALSSTHTINPNLLPICRACARSLTRDLGWPCLARSTLGRHASAQWLGRGCCCPGLITDTHLSLRKSPLVSRSLPLPR